MTHKRSTGKDSKSSADSVLGEQAAPGRGEEGGLVLSYSSVLSFSYRSS